MVTAVYSYNTVWNARIMEGKYALKLRQRVIILFNTEGLINVLVKNYRSAVPVSYSSFYTGELFVDTIARVLA